MQRQQRLSLHHHVFTKACISLMHVGLHLAAVWWWFLNPHFLALCWQVAPPSLAPDKGMPCRPQCCPPRSGLAASSSWRASVIWGRTHMCHTSSSLSHPHAHADTHIFETPSNLQGTISLIVCLPLPFRLVRPRAAYPQDGLKTLAGALFH